MTRRRDKVQAAQLAFGFGELETDTRDGYLADLARAVAGVVGQMLKGDPRSRYDVAADVSRLLDEDVSKLMLDAYSSPARDAHRISADRLLALTASTGRYDLLRTLTHRIGADLVVGDEVILTHVGHLRAQRRQIDEQLRRYESAAEPMKRSGGSR